jgi:transcription initiation factor IIE alpha subunit
MNEELKYKNLSDEEVVEELRNRLNRVKELLIEVRDLLKSIG